MSSADEGGNGRATIREVYELVDRTRKEILTTLQALAHDTDEAQNRTDSRMSVMESAIARLDERFTIHEELDGHPGVLRGMNEQKITLARWAAVGMAVFIIFQLGLSVGLKFI